MSKNVMQSRLRSLVEGQGLQWPPVSASQVDLAFASQGSGDSHTSVDIDTLLHQLQATFPDYRRQKFGVLRKTLFSVISDYLLAHDVLRQKPDVEMEDLTALPSRESRRRSPEPSGPELLSLNATMTGSWRRSSSADRDKPESGGKAKKKARKEEPEPLESRMVFIPERNITSRLHDVGGIDSIVGDITDLVVRPLKFPQIYRYLGVQPTKGILLHGPPGSGKSKLAEAIAGEAGCAFFRVAATELVTGMSGESESRLRDLFDQAKRSAPSIIFIDEIDSVTPKRENSSRELEKRIVAQLGICMDSLADHFVIVIGATNRQECLDPMIRRNGRFDREISMGIPDTDSRFSILRAVSRGMRIGEDVDFEEIATMTPGFVGADLQAVTREAAACAITRIFSQHGGMFPEDPCDLSSAFVSQADFRAAVGRVQPSAQREGFATIPNVTWDNIGALAHLRKEMEEHIVFPIMFKKLYRTFGLTVPAGILLYGPPGCGKTLLAKAVANGSKANFISVKGPELLNKYVGESERAVRLIFQRAAVSAPCVVFFDEVDSLCPIRNNESNHATERVVNQLLTEMDGIQNRREVYVLAATNRPDIIDPAMLRPGRLERQMYVPLPDDEGRVDILRKLTRDIPLGPDVDLYNLSNQTHGYSGADLASLVREAGIAAVEKLRSQLCATGVGVGAIRSAEAPPGACITSHDISIALSKVTPSVTQHQIDFYEQFLRRSR
ncbi:ATPase AAA type domain containing protein [Babesia ovis]|uniref:ATPase AAA type domain containing protein n=1 Tax=Babesia ovis TaxID=5869 RepID=A0A9W5WUV8_BABOV|nr:ATPase AAA type domain containing protein [Babesia ovis]